MAWRACLRCVYTDGTCRKCGRPKGAAKNWRPMEEELRVGDTADAPSSIASADEPTAPPDVSEPESAPAVAEPDAPAPSVSEPLWKLAGLSSDPQTDVEVQVTASVIVPAVVEPEPAQAVAEARPFGLVVEAANPSATDQGALSGDAPEHSPLGGSAASRYMACPGSVELIRLMGLHATEDDGDEPEDAWTAEGSIAHALAAHCLENNIPDTVAFIGAPDKWQAVTVQMAEAVQHYLEYVYSRPGRRLVEFGFKCSLHPLMWGRIDCVCYSVTQDNYLEVIDYKHGAGVVVPAEHNKQLLYYAAGLIASDWSAYTVSMPIKLTIVQPNAWHREGRIRSWTTTVGDVIRWLHEELLPAMQRVETDTDRFVPGEHCRFCPAKLYCPEFDALKSAALANAAGITGSERDPKVPEGWRPMITAEDAKLLTMLISAYRKWAFKELMNGVSPDVVGAKLILGKADRVWKDGAMPALIQALGGDAYNAPELKSPAQVEKEPGGKALVAQWAYKPEGRPTVAPLSAEGIPAMPNSASAIYGAHVNKALASAVRE